MSRIMSRSTWKTLNILITNQDCHETQARQLNTTEATTEPLETTARLHLKQNCTEPSPHYHQDSCYQNITTHTTIHRHMLDNMKKLEATSHVVVATENNMVAFRTLKLHLPCNPKYPEIFPKNRK